MLQKGKEKADLILFNGWMITMDSERRVIRDGAVAIRNGEILMVGKNCDVTACYEGEQYDCRGGVVHPGLVDAHEHLCLHITRGWEPDTFSVHDTWTMFESLAYPAVSEREEAASVEFAALEMAKNGITTFSDTGSAFHLESIIEPVNRVGIRGIVGEIAGDCFPPELSFLSCDSDTILKKMDHNLGKYRSGRVFAGAQIAGMGDCSDELVTGAKELARKYGQNLFMHQCVYPEESLFYQQKYGKSPIAHLADLDILDPSTTLVHMIHLDDKDVELIHKTNTNVVHCPAASLKYGLGAASIGKFPEMCAAGVNIALGTDSGTWSDALDVLHLAYLAATIHREARRERTSINSYRAFEMATIGGAIALGMGDRIGSLEKGKRADIVVHTPDIPECQPSFDPFTNLIFSARSKSVDTVLVDGDFIVKNRKAVHVDEESVCAVARQTAFDFAKRIGYTVKTPWKMV